MFTAAHIHIFFANRRTSGRSAVEAVTTKRLLDDKKMFPTLATGMGFRFRPSCISQRAMKDLGVRFCLCALDLEMSARLIISLPQPSTKPCFLTPKAHSSKTSQGGIPLCGRPMSDCCLGALVCQGGVNSIRRNVLGVFSLFASAPFFLSSTCYDTAKIEVYHGSGNVVSVVLTSLKKRNTNPLTPLFSSYLLPSYSVRIPKQKALEAARHDLSCIYRPCRSTAATAPQGNNSSLQPGPANNTRSSQPRRQQAYGERRSTDGTSLSTHVR